MNAQTKITPETFEAAYARAMVALAKREGRVVKMPEGNWTGKASKDAEKILSEIYNLLDTPKSIREVATETGRSYSGIQNYMDRLHNQKRIKRIKTERRKGEPFTHNYTWVAI